MTAIISPLFLYHHVCTPSSTKTPTQNKNVRLPKFSMTHLGDYRVSDTENAKTSTFLLTDTLWELLQMSLCSLQQL